MLFRSARRNGDAEEGRRGAAAAGDDDCRPLSDELRVKEETSAATWCFLFDQLRMDRLVHGLKGRAKEQNTPGHNFWRTSGVIYIPYYQCEMLPELLACLVPF